MSHSQPGWAEACRTTVLSPGTPSTETPRATLRKLPAPSARPRHRHTLPAPLRGVLGYTRALQPLNAELPGFRVPSLRSRAPSRSRSEGMGPSPGSTRVPQPRSEEGSGLYPEPRIPAPSRLRAPQPRSTGAASRPRTPHRGPAFHPSPAARRRNYVQRRPCRPRMENNPVCILALHPFTGQRPCSTAPSPSSTGAPPRLPPELRGSPGSEQEERGLAARRGGRCVCAGRTCAEVAMPRRRAVAVLRRDSMAGTAGASGGGGGTGDSNDLQGPRGACAAPPTALARLPPAAGRGGSLARSRLR